MPDLIEAAVRAGHPERAREPANQLTSWADDLQQPHFTAQAHRCAALTGPDASAEKHYATALDLHTAGCDFERARTELVYGEWLRRGRRRLDARDHLRTARSSSTSWTHGHGPAGRPQNYRLPARPLTRPMSSTHPSAA